MALNRDTIYRPGGERWHHYELADGFAITTASWQGLVAEHPGLHKELAAYRREIAAAYIGEAVLNPVRTLIAGGNDGTVYALGDSLVVKEAKPWGSKSFQEYFERMENLRGVIQEHLPHWVATPANYALYVSADRARQHLFMQRIGVGITAYDLHHPEDATELKQHKLNRMLERMDEDDLGDLDNRVHEVHMKLVDALRGENLREGEYLKDWGPHNVIVERLNAPIADSPFRLWIIDQQ